MQPFCDIHGFPMLGLRDLNIALALLPLTKVQFERWLVEAGTESQRRFNDEWYEKALTLNPRASWRKSEPPDALGWWLTGIHPEEAVFITNHLPHAYIPTHEEWLRAEFRLSREQFTPQDVADLQKQPLHEAARNLIHHRVSERMPSTWAEFMLLQGGVLEWVRWESPVWNRVMSGFGALGSPPCTTLVPQVDGPRHFYPSDVPSRWNGLRVWHRR